MRSHNWHTTTIGIAGDGTFVNDNKVYPNAFKVKGFVFPTSGFLVGLWLSTSFTNPGGELLGVWVGLGRGADQEINVERYEQIYHHHTSRSTATISLASGVSLMGSDYWPGVTREEELSIWYTNSTDANVIIDTNLTIFWMDEYARPAREKI